MRATADLYFVGLSFTFVSFCAGSDAMALIDKRIPDKWRNYRPCGVPIRNERIIAFKTPLSEKYDNESSQDNGIRNDERFTPNDLLQEIRRQRETLGLVVDFTNTFRYYNGREFEEQGVDYEKLKCVGKEIPNEQVVNRFKSIALDFYKQHQAARSDALIGVHCTHGLNRAGYIVCRFLIECRGFEPDRAIAAFNQARGHVMERENYLEDLKKRRPAMVRQGSSRLKRTISPDRDDRNFIPPRDRNYVPPRTMYSADHWRDEDSDPIRKRHKADYSANYEGRYYPTNDRQQDASFGRTTLDRFDYSRHDNVRSSREGYDLRSTISGNDYYSRGSHCRESYASPEYHPRDTHHGYHDRHPSDSRDRHHGNRYSHHGNESRCHGSRYVDRPRSRSGGRDKYWMKGYRD